MGRPRAPMTCWGRACASSDDHPQGEAACGHELWKAYHWPNTWNPGKFTNFETIEKWNFGQLFL